jgi:hypothetical protein
MTYPLEDDVSEESSSVNSTEALDVALEALKVAQDVRAFHLGNMLRFDDRTKSMAAEKRSADPSRSAQKEELRTLLASYAEAAETLQALREAIIEQTRS